MAITQNHVINIQPGVSAPLVIHCSQGDTGTQINLTVVNGDEEFDCSSYACSVHGVRSDGANWGPFPVTVSGSTVSFSLRQEMTAVAGPCLAEITIGTVGTANFAILVENATFGPGVTYTEDVSLYQSILNYIMGAVQGIKTETTTSVNTATSALNAKYDTAIDQMNTNTNAINAKYDAAIDQMNTTANDLQNQYAVTNAKLDTAISAATQDSEVQDIRVKADGTSATTAGNAVREQITELKNDLNKIESESKRAFVTGHYINASGVESTNNNYVCTDYVPCSEESIIYLSDVHAGPSSLAYAFYAEDKTFISGQNNVDGDISVAVPTGAKYVRFSSQITNETPSAIVLNEKMLENIVTEQGAKIDDLNKLNKIESESKRKLNKMFPVEPVSTTFFENLNYGVPQNVTFYNNRYINASGKIITEANTSSIVFNAKPNTTYFLYAPLRNRQMIGETASDFVVGSTYTVLTTTQVSQYNGIYVLKFTTGATAKKVIAYIYSGAYDYEANKNDIIITENDFVPTIQPIIMNDYIPKREIVVTPKETTFFYGINYFSDDTVTYYTDRVLNNTEGIIQSSGGVSSISFPCEPNTEYYIYIPNNNRGVIGESADGTFSVGTVLNLLYSSGPSVAPYHVTTSANAKYLFVYFCSSSYDYEANKENIVINKNKYAGNITPFIAQEHLPSNLKNALLGKNVLIFGDSITDTCNFTINSSDETTAMTWKNPSNSYVNAGGQTIRYNMWPKMLKDMGICAEVRNYARQGASFKDATRPSGEERQNVSYQITVALNDLSNPHDVFDVDDFVPDIVIFALGTNDGTPNDNYDSAMAKTVLKSDGYSIDTTATLANLDMSKFCEAARSAFLRTRIAFPYAQFFCVLPIQRANNEVNGGGLNTYLSRMAKRYGCVVIDGFAESGMIRDTNNWNALGETLKDGLHPNDKGQNMLFRAIYSSLLSHYVNSEVMNP